MHPRHIDAHQLRPSTPRGRRWTVLGLVNAMVMSLTMAGFFIVASASPAHAAETPPIAIAVSGPTDALIQSGGTPLTFTATVTNPSPNPNGYNLGYKVTLPPGVTFVNSSVGAPDVIDTSGTSTVLFFENVADILTSSTNTLSVDVKASDTTYRVNAPVSVTIDAYANSDPRTAPTMSGTTVTGDSGKAEAAATSIIKAIKITKSEPSLENELVRGVHDHTTLYTLKVTTNGANTNKSVVVDDYLPAGLEFLGCGTWDNTTISPTSGLPVEYPGAPRLDVSTPDETLATLALPLTGTTSGCLVPTSVTTVTVDPDGPGSAPLGVYTHVVWTIGNMSAASELNITYRAGIPMRENTMTWPGATPATVCSAGNCDQAANLDNNSGPETTDEQNLTNVASANGTYNGTVAPATSAAVTDTNSLTITAENLAMQKSVDQTKVVRGGISTWTLKLETGEYRSVDKNLFITDTLPNGLCPLGGNTNYAHNPDGQDAECASTGLDPSFPYASDPVENSDGTWTVTFAVTAGMTANSTLSISFPTKAREYYQSGFVNTTPVLASDSWTNTVKATSTATGVISGTDVPNTPAEPAPDESSATQSSTNPGLKKLVSVPAPAGTLDCNTATYVDANTVTDAAKYYRPNDMVCFKINLTLNDAASTVGSNLYFGDVAVTDFLPPGFTFYKFWGKDPVTGQTSNDLITSGVSYTAPAKAGDPMTWKLGKTLGTGSTLYVDANSEKVFEVAFSATAPMSNTGGSMLQAANLAKATTVNSAGVATSLRDPAISLLTRPSLSLTKTRNPATATVAPGSSIAYTLTAKNNAAAETGSNYGAAYDPAFRDLLPTQIGCADIVLNSISDGGLCTLVGSRSQIDWTLTGTHIDPQAEKLLTYTIKLPVTLAPGEVLTNNAGVRDYWGPVNTGLASTRYVPSSNIDPSLEPLANSPQALGSQTVTLDGVSVVKQQMSELSESGNSRNAGLSASADQATIGEYVDYVLQTTIPANSTVYGAKMTDTLPTGLALVTTGPAAPSATLNSVALPLGWSFAVDAATNTVTVTPPATYGVGGTADVVQIHFRAVVTNTPDNAASPVGKAAKTNTTNFTYTTLAGNSLTGSASTNLTVVEPSLSMAKADSTGGSPVSPGQFVTYTLKSTNSGSAAHDVVVTDCVPAHLTVVDPSVVAPSGGTVAIVKGDATCLTGTLLTWTYPAGYSLDQGAANALTLTYQVQVDAPTTAGQTFVNSAKTTATSYEGVNSEKRTTYVAVASDEVKSTPPTVTKSVSPLNATVGSELTYTVTAHIPGGLAAPDATIVDVVPAGVAFEALTGVTCTNAPAGPPAYVCPTLSGSTWSGVSVLQTAGVSAGTGGNLNFFLDDLPASAAAQPWSITLTYKASVHNLVALTSGSTLANTAQLRWDAASKYTLGGTEPNPNNLSAFDLNTLNATASTTLHEPKIVTDKDVTYTAASTAGCDQVADATTGATDADSCTMAPNGASPSMKYTVTVKNTGDWPAYDLTIKDTPSSEIASVTLTGPGNGGTTGPVGTVANPTDLTFTYAGPLAPGASLTITYTADLNTSAAYKTGDQVINTVQVPSFYGVPQAERLDAANASRTYRTYTGGADTDIVTLDYPKPTITKAALSDATDARIGQAFTYSLTVTNAATVASLYKTNLSDVLPAGWTYVSGSATVVTSTGTTPSSITIGDPAVTPPILPTDPTTLTWTNIATLAPGGTFTVTYQAIPTSLLATTVTTGTAAHVNSATVTGSDATNATGNGGGAYTADSSATVHIRRVDLSLTKTIAPPTGTDYYYGQVVPYTVTVTNNGPDAATGVTVLDKLPTGLILQSATPVGAYAPGTGMWTVGSLASGASATLTLTVRINASGTIVNNAEVETADQWDPNSTPGNMSTSPSENDGASVLIETKSTSLGDRVWYDINKDGVQDPTEPGIAGVKVTLQDPGPDGDLATVGDNGPTVTTTTDANGNYLFTGLAVNRPYTVTVDPTTLPKGMAQTYDLDGKASANTTLATIPNSGTGLTTVDFGYTGVGSIGDTVWFDTNGSATATQDGGEPGIPGIPVKVTWAGADLTFGTADDVVFDTTTNASGNYLVPNLPNGDYTVVVDTASPKFPAGLTPTYDADGATLSPNASAVTLTPTAPDNLNQDFSYTGTASLGDWIWLDQNGNGVQDPGELGIPNVGVTVTYLGADGVAGGGDDIVFTTVTDAGGKYLVDRLPAGNYTVSVNTATLPVGLTETYQLDKGTGSSTAAVLGSGEAKLDVDFGYVGTSQIGDQIWLDTLGNGDGTFNVGSDYPLTGVAVTVTYLGPNGVLGGGDDIVYTTTTDANGKYLFTNVPLGAYTVTVVPPANLTPTFDSNGVGTPNTSAVTLTTGAPVNLNQDFSYKGAGSIGDLVWLDRNNSGTPTADAGEPGIAGVPVTITWAGADGSMGTADDIVIHRVTDANGGYLVQNLPLGSYSVSVDTTASTFPAGLVQTYDADTIATPNLSTVSLTNAVPDALNQDFSYGGHASIGDKIWLDQNGDGVQAPSELGIPAVTVHVTYLGPDGVLGGGDDLVFTTTTAADGTYVVDGLPSGAYTVAVDPTTLPAGLTGTFDLDGVGSANTAAVTLATNEVRRDVDFGYKASGSIGDQVWLDTQNSGSATFDPAPDRPLAGVAITVTYLGLDGKLGGGDDMVFTTTTDANGTYLVGGLPMGDYVVGAVPPVALTETYDSDGKGTANTSAVSLTTDAPANLAQDFAYTGSASIGDLVWHDRNANGVVDPGEEGIAGVTVIPTWAGPDGLFGTADDIILPSVTTGTNGAYLIPNLPAGSYRVAIDPTTVPAGYVPTYDVDAGNLESSTVSLAAGQHRTDVDFGLREVADLMIVKSHPAGAIDAGGTVTFRITVTNLGPGVARAVQVVDTLPAGLTITAVTATGWTCTTVGQEITCDLAADLASSDAAYLDISTTTSVQAAPSVVNSATVTSSTPDVNPDNNLSIDPVVVNAADLVLKKAVIGTLVSGKNAEYVLTISNLGPSTVPAGKVVVTDVLPSLLTAVSATSTDFTCSITGQNVVCTNKAAYPAGSVSKITIIAKVGKASTGTSITNTAHVTGGFIDPTPNDEVDAATLTITRLPGTGSDIPWMVPLIALALLGTGGGLLLVARRRRVQQ